MNLSAVQSFRKKLSEHQTVRGLWITLASPSISEIAVALGLDGIVIDAEDGHLDWSEITAHLRSTVRSEILALVRLSENSVGLIKRALDVGADGVIIPWVEERAQLEAAVKAAHYPPTGLRGTGAERATCWGKCFPRLVEEAEGGVLAAPLIESVTGVRNITDLAAGQGMIDLLEGRTPRGVINHAVLDKPTFQEKWQRLTHSLQTQ